MEPPHIRDDESTGLKQYSIHTITHNMGPVERKTPSHSNEIHHLPQHKAQVKQRYIGEKPSVQLLWCHYLLVCIVQKNALSSVYTQGFAGSLSVSKRSKSCNA